MGENTSQVIQLSKTLQGSNIEVLAEPKPKGPWIEFLSPSEIAAYVPPEGTLLVGNNHIVRGGIGVLGGCPGVGKSRSTVGLAEAGATMLDWLGLPVHCHFRTMIIQNENGKYRLQLEFTGLETSDENRGRMKRFSARSWMEKGVVHRLG